MMVDLVIADLIIAVVVLVFVAAVAAAAARISCLLSHAAVGCSCSQAEK
jgi:hypothetical protein